MKISGVIIWTKKLTDFEGFVKDFDHSGAQVRSDNDMYEV